MLWYIVVLVERYLRGIVLFDKTNKWKKEQDCERNNEDPPRRVQVSHCERGPKVFWGHYMIRVVGFMMKHKLVTSHAHMLQAPIVSHIWLEIIRSLKLQHQYPNCQTTIICNVGVTFVLATNRNNLHVVFVACLLFVTAYNKSCLSFFFGLFLGSHSLTHTHFES